MRVEPVPGELYNKGFTVWICQIDENGREQDVTAVRFQFDENEEEFLMIKVATGVEVTQGEAELVQTLKNVAQATAAAIDSYYTFGSAMDGYERARARQTERDTCSFADPSVHTCLSARRSPAAVRIFSYCSLLPSSTSADEGGDRGRWVHTLTLPDGPKDWSRSVNHLRACGHLCSSARRVESRCKLQVQCTYGDGDSSSEPPSLP